jgi:hypothetical protein
MAHKELIVALGMIIAASPVAASQPEPEPTMAAPPGTPDTRYCMRIEAVTGTRIERIECWTREEWAEQEVDVDKEWAKEGVQVIG